MSDLIIYQRPVDTPTTPNPADELAWLQQDTHTRLTQIAQDALKIGENLTRAKELCPHGEWLPWLKGAGIGSERKAQFLMAAYKRFKNETVAGIGLSALYVLAGADEDAVTSAQALAASGVTVNKAAAKVIVEAPAPIRDRFTKQQLTLPQARGLVEVAKEIKSPEVLKLTENVLTDPRAALALDVMMAAGDEDDRDAVETAAATGFWQAGTTEPIPVAEITIRDIDKYHDEKRRERIVAKIAEQWEIVVDGRRATIQAAEDGVITLVIESRELPILLPGERVRVRIERSTGG